MLAKQGTHVDVYIQNNKSNAEHHTLQNYELTWTLQQEQTSHNRSKQNIEGINNIHPHVIV